MQDRPWLLVVMSIAAFVMSSRLLHACPYGILFDTHRRVEAFAELGFWLDIQGGSGIFRPHGGKTNGRNDVKARE